MEQQRQVSVIGAGFSGLTAAYYLHKNGFQVRVLEKTERAGGLLGTHATEWGLVEQAANGLLNTALLEDFALDLGLKLIPAKRESRRRYIWRGRPRRLPLGAFESFAVARLIMTFLRDRTALSPEPRESVHHWGEKIAGSAVNQYIIEAALQGIYAGDPTRMSATGIFGRLFSREKVRHRRPRVHGTVAPAGGMSELTERLMHYLQANGVEIAFGREVNLKDAPKHPHVIATSARAAAGVLATVDSARATALSAVEMLPAISVTLFFKANDVTSPEMKGAAPSGFGCLFPPALGRLSLGVLFNSSIFPGRGAPDYRSETWILGGALGGAGRTSAELLSMDDESLISSLLLERQQVFGGILLKPAGHRITRWPEALPHYTIDLEKRWPDIRRDRHNVFLIGNYLGRIGLSSILESASGLPMLLHEGGKWT